MRPDIRQRLERINHKRRVPVIRRQLDEQRASAPADVIELRGLTRHQMFGHPKPVVTCPLCIGIYAGELNRRRAA